MGAGVTGIAVCKILKDYNVPTKNIYLVDSKGLVPTKRTDLNKWKKWFANPSEKKTLDDLIIGADIYIGLSKGG